MHKKQIIRALVNNPNKTLRLTVTDPERITPIGTLYNCTWIFQLTNSPTRTLEELRKENGICSFQASWWTNSIKHAVDTCVELAETSFDSKGQYEYELCDEEGFDYYSLIYIAVYIKYTPIPTMEIDGN